MLEQFGDKPVEAEFARLPCLRFTIRIGGGIGLWCDTHDLTEITRVEFQKRNRPRGRIVRLNDQDMVGVGL